MATRTTNRGWTRPESTDPARIEDTVGVPLDDADADVQGVADDVAALEADGSVTTARLADRAVTSAKIADRAVTSAKIADRAVTPRQVTLLSGDVPLGSDRLTGERIPPPNDAIVDLMSTRVTLDVASVLLVTITADFDAQITSNDSPECYAYLYVNGVAQPRTARFRPWNEPGNTRWARATVQQVNRLTLAAGVHTLAMRAHYVAHIAGSVWLRAPGTGISYLGFAS